MPDCVAKLIIEGPECLHTTDLIDSFIIRKMNETGIVGIGAAIIVRGNTVWSEGYGFADREREIPFTPKTVMSIASISKTFTGVCLMKAVEENKLSLDEDINRYLPFRIENPKFPGEKITLRQLATHTSSLADGYPFYEDSTYYYNGAAPEALGPFLKNYFTAGGTHYTDSNFLPHKPGTYREYSNIAAGLAGYIVELRTGMSLQEYGRKHIFKPLDMNSSGWSIDAVKRSAHSQQYEKKGDAIAIVPIYETTTYPDRGVRSSVADLSRFFTALLNNGSYNGVQLLKEESVREMQRFHFNESNTPLNVKPEKLNSGIFWATKMSNTRIGHNGSDRGVRTFMLADLTKEVGVIFFANTSLTEKEEGKYFDIYEGIYKYALQHKNDW